MPGIPLQRASATPASGLNGSRAGMFPIAFGLWLQLLLCHGLAESTFLDNAFPLQAALAPVEHKNRSINKCCLLTPPPPPMFPPPVFRESKSLEEINLKNVPLKIKSNESLCNVTGIIGPPGPTGPQGPRGIPGIMGPKGETFLFSQGSTAESPHPEETETSELTTAPHHSHHILQEHHRGLSPPPTQNIAQRHSISRASSIVKDPSRPPHSLFDLLPSGRREKLEDQEEKAVQAYQDPLECQGLQALQDQLGSRVKWEISD